MGRELPSVVCKSCNIRQTYRGQADCTSCGRRLSNWSVATQLRAASEREALERQYSLGDPGDEDGR